MRYAGIDLHGKYSVVSIVDSAGKRICEDRLPNDATEVDRFFRRFTPIRAVVESTGNWHWFFDTLQESGVQACLAHPYQVKAIASARLKNDRVDARILAHLLRSNLVPECYVPSPEIRTLRELVRYRVALVRLQSGLKRRLRALLAKRNLKIEARTLDSRRGREELKAFQVDARARQEIDQVLGLLEHMHRCELEVNREIRKKGGADPRIELLESVPGVGEFLALLILAEIGEIDRFASARKLTSYAGIVPATRSSGGHTYYGRITKQGSRWLRWAVIEAVMHAPDPPALIFF